MPQKEDIFSKKAFAESMVDAAFTIQSNSNPETVREARFMAEVVFRGTAVTYHAKHHANDGTTFSDTVNELHDAVIEAAKERKEDIKGIELEPIVKFADHLKFVANTEFTKEEFATNVTNSAMYYDFILPIIPKEAETIKDIAKIYHKTMATVYHMQKYPNNEQSFQDTLQELNKAIIDNLEKYLNDANHPKEVVQFYNDLNDFSRGGFVQRLHRNIAARENAAARQR